MWNSSCHDQLVEAFFVVVLRVPEGAFFTLVLLFAREEAVAFLVRPRAVRAVAFLTTVDDLPYVFGVWESDEVSPVVATFLRVLLRAVAPFCSGRSIATSCCSTYSR